MGARLALAAYDVAAEVGLSHSATRLLVRQCLSALDEADRPWSSLPIDQLMRAMNVDIPDPDNYADEKSYARARASAEETVYRARKQIVDAGLIARDKPGNRSGVARFDLLFTADGTRLQPVDKSTPAAGKPHENRAPNLTKSAEKPHENREAHKEEKKEPKEEAAAPAPPPCKKHPLGWNHDDPCRQCAAARKAAAAIFTAEPATVQPGRHCDPGTHRVVADGTCLRCDRHPEDIRAERAYA